MTGLAPPLRRGTRYNVEFRHKQKVAQKGWHHIK
jgi:hypothetical protein